MTFKSKEDFIIHYVNHLNKGDKFLYDNYMDHGIKTVEFCTQQGIIPVDADYETNIIPWNDVTKILTPEENPEYFL